MLKCGVFVKNGFGQELDNHCMDMDWIGQELIDFCKLPVEVSDDCGPARLRGLPLDLLGLAVVHSNKELDKDKEEKEVVEEEERRLGTLGWAGTAILAQPPSRPPSPPRPTTHRTFTFSCPAGFFSQPFFPPKICATCFFLQVAATACCTPISSPRFPFWIFGEYFL